ncbi:MAG: sporulation protein YtfJ [Oscillospiraceae bacterium]|jgi:sporulation protein YtfJ|nr:sporulation protein YtfJ [Oscillospiraceae bacterium]
MSEHPIQGLMGTSMEKIREMVDVNTIIGDPISCPDGTVIIPVSKVGFGFAAGGSDWPSKQPKELFGGASGAGVSIQPLAFLVVSKGEVKILQIDTASETADRVVGIVPEVIQTVADLFQKNKKEKAAKESPDAEPEQE